MLAGSTAIHVDRGHAERGRHKPRLDGRCAGVRGGGFARARGGRESAGGNCMAKEIRSGSRARVAVRVQPRAKATRIAGRVGEMYRLQLAAPPVDGKANEECIAFFAELAGVPKSRVRIVKGLTSRMKVVEIDGVTQELVESRLG